MSAAAPEPVARESILEPAEAAWQHFQASLGGLTEDDYERPGIEGVWSLKDVLSHLCGWFAEANRCLEAYRLGAPFPALPDIDAYNAQSVALRVNAAPLAVLDELRELRAAWVTAVKAIPAERFTTQVTRHWSIAAMVDHYEEHESAVRRAHDLAVSPN